MRYRHLTKEMRALVKRELDSGKVKVEDVIHNIDVEEFLSSRKSDVQVIEEPSWFWNGKIYTSTLGGELQYYIDRYLFRKNK